MIAKTGMRCLAFLALAIGLSACGQETGTWGEGAITSGEPLQQETDEDSWIMGDYTIEPLASFELEARVLGTRRYRTGREADLSPVDFALGWGPMSDEANLAPLNISQSGRWYRYSWQGQPPIPLRDIIRHSSNMHLIPASPEVEELLLAVNPGDKVRLEGFLIRASAPDGWRWRSSLSRSDSGGGACELFYVEAIDWTPAPFPG